MGEHVSSGNRLYLFAAGALISVLLVGSIGLAFNVEGRVVNRAELTAAYSRRSDVDIYIRTLLDAESAQRGYLLTGKQSHLLRFEDAKRRSTALLDQLTRRYLSDDQATPREVREKLHRMSELGTARMAELESPLSLEASGRHDQAVEIVQTGSDVLDELRTIAAELEAYDNASIAQTTDDWRSGIIASRILIATGAILNVGLVVLAVMLLNRDLKRRDSETQHQEQLNRDLESLVHQRTEELSALSSYLQSVAEHEKAQIARELHDELGSLMVAAKMDVAWLERRLSRPDDELRSRWLRLRKLLDDGVDLKRRVVETLRPTLLDNMGLVAAVRWVFAETCGRAGLKCTDAYPEDAEELRFSEEAAIAVFRVIQESLINIVKHAKATTADLTMKIEDGQLKVTIRDNGVGLPNTPQARRKHGLAGMRHRVNSFGGTWHASTAENGGTLVEMALPLDRILQPAVATVEPEAFSDVATPVG
jgi:signal transduction histidine kinase